ncbi:transcription antitermination factor NusB [Enterococcus sp. DIV0212c]|uniref:Transcription antitermination protein NusB n=2 Tax=Enterococcus TaxID=1350 RepID=A0AAQ3Y508_9ENTE|nr:MULTISPECIES: transcription antitermination factor NusB [unclassified Enterococcus]MBO0439173.1 transcription antitermination factor NusB [Enterococcus sp. DIV0869a]MBO1352835.1 transcription antitermination factor NusB [Enterococcus sp. DIV0212c]OTN85978.1 transcription antitermination factor NusB [Enterococcus sp. 7F3_DIV0205]
MSKPSFTRHEIREKALQALFPLDFNVDLTKQDAISYALELDNQEIISEDGEEFVPTYLDLLVGGVCDRKAELDEIIKKHLGNNWSISRIAKMDLIILRMAIFEMLYVGDVPNTVALDEAIELAKKYSDDRSRKFVNGVLANVMKDIDSK